MGRKYFGTDGVRGRVGVSPIWFRMLYSMPLMAMRNAK